MDHKPNVITVYNSKGGVGKTTLVALLGVWLAGGENVAIIDLDQQGSQSIVFDLVDEAGRAGESLHLVLQRRLDVLAALVPVAERLIPAGGERRGDLYVVPGGPQTAEAIEDIAANPMRYKMASALEIVRGPIADLAGHVDTVLIDMGPSDQVSALVGLVATDRLVIPTQTDLWSVERVAAVMDEVAVARQVQPGLEVAAIVPTLTRYYFGGLRKSQAMQAGEAFLKRNYDELLLRDARGLVDLPYHEDVRKAAWLGETVLTANVGRQAKDDAIRLVNALTLAIRVKEQV